MVAYFGHWIFRRMFVEIIGKNRLHVTADDMPLGADITLHEKGFYFTPYLIWFHYKGRRWRLKCMDENMIDDSGVINDRIRMFFMGFPIATMHLAVKVDRS